MEKTEEKEQRMSPSQVSLWRECQRKWAFRHIAKIVLPAHPGAALGTDTHTQLAHVLAGGHIDYHRPSGYIAETALPYLPPPNSPGMILEEHFNYRSPGGLLFHGYMDVQVPDSSVFPNLVVPSPAPGVSDHKTTKHFKYAKTPEDLLVDPQAIIYAKATMDKYQSSAVDLVWTYLLTTGARKAKRTHLRVVPNDIEDEFQKIELTTSEIHATRIASPDPKELPPTLSQCDEYGGCPYKSYCKPPVFNRSKMIMNETTEKMLNNLKAKSESEVPGLPTWASTPSDPQPTSDPFASFLKPTVATSPINPPESVLPPPPVVAAAPVEEKVKGKRVRRTNAQIAADKAAEAAAILTPNFSNDDGPAMEIHTGDINPTPVLHQIQEPRKELTVISAALEAYTAPTKQPGFTLYVDCFPVGKSFTSAEEIFAVAASKIKEQGFDDYRLVEFGKGSGIFAALVSDLVESGNYGDIVLDSRTPEGALCVVGLSARAGRGNVVRGSR